jgi:hypothetical protein
MSDWAIRIWDRETWGSYLLPNRFESEAEARMWTTMFRGGGRL